MDEQISVRHAFLAMHSFLNELYTLYEFEQFGGLLGSMSLLADGTPVDPAIWSDWLKAVEAARKRHGDANLRLGKTDQQNGDTDAPPVPQPWQSQ